MSVTFTSKLFRGRRISRSRLILTGPGMTGGYGIMTGLEIRMAESPDGSVQIDKYRTIIMNNPKSRNESTTVTKLHYFVTNNYNLVM